VSRNSRCAFNEIEIRGVFDALGSKIRPLLVFACESVIFFISCSFGLSCPNREYQILVSRIFQSLQQLSFSDMAYDFTTLHPSRIHRASVLYLSAMCKCESTNTVILIYRKWSYRKRFGHINVSCPMNSIYVVLSVTKYCSCMLLKVGLYSINFEAHVIAVYIHT